ncbi:hypothetical protein A8135_12065 [Legionella jamestowniensis]|uniref:DUF72 domain-containing protein n=1 Tax=Legionella jamestowniensis TaxID=455 RepID=A0ABX2XUH5_9GAMM|nr:DUF72 domain-containing protein [Legionella jamestowniensis]OCH98287.1 hypothetical protein A8135_12065 [Legionella jamestowniensis]
MQTKDVYIGTSGWSYGGWIGRFYPEKIKPDGVLPYYAKTFDSVELNNSFYQIPKEKNIKKWLNLTPPHFIFSCKANRYITHTKKLQDTEESVVRLLHAFSHFEEKLGPILFQFPPYWPLDLSCLKNFIEHLPSNYFYTFEFRHKSWFCEPLYELLQKHQMTLCFYDFKTYQSPEIVTGKFIYIRMHGPQKEAYQGSYSEEVLIKYTQKINHWQQEGKPVYCYFDNDEKCCAPKDAQRLKHLIDHTKAI